MPQEAWNVKDISKLISTAQEQGLKPHHAVKALIAYRSRRRKLAEFLLKQRYEEQAAKRGDKF